MSTPPKDSRREQDWSESGKSGWKHPYVIYVVLVLLIFLGLVFGAFLALQQGWIPQRV
jgi:cell division protein FtsB